VIQQTVSPHTSHTPQSHQQLEQSSAGAQILSPHVGAQVPQSTGHVLQDSMKSHVPSPQPGQRPQSRAHDSHVSVVPHEPSPHRSGHAPQSAPQLRQDSVQAQKPSPHTGAHTPQSCWQLEQVSPPSHL
jgi:hypothetical protein